MRELKIEKHDGLSRILVGESLRNVGQYLPNKKLIILTDANVRRLYGHLFPAGEIIEIGVGEEHKTLDTIKMIMGRMLELEFDRSSYLLAIGGGLVCDVAGFASSIFMRGIPCSFVSTTLLAQVDASVGGKNGVNYEGLKNMIGTFSLPDAVLCDMELLKTLPHEEILSGFAEIVKHGAIADAALFDFIEQNAEKALQLDAAVIERFVYDSVVVKATIVNQDPNERGERRKLNFGHTFGHAIEKITKVPHGLAVSMGMVVAAELSVRRGLLSRADADRLRNVLKKLQLPVDMNIDKDAALAAMKRDKKREGNTMHFVLLTSIGSSVVQEITMDELKTIVDDLCSNSRA